MMTVGGKVGGDRLREGGVGKGMVEEDGVKVRGEGDGLGGGMGRLDRERDGVGGIEVVSEGVEVRGG